MGVPGKLGEGAVAVMAVLTDVVDDAKLEEIAAAAKALQESASHWDADEWLRGANLPTVTVKLTGRADLASRIDEAHARVEAASTGRPRTYSDPVRKEAQTEFEALCEQYEGSKKAFTVRARKPGDQEAIAAALKAAGESYSGEVALVYATAHYLVDPVLTPAQVKLLAEKLGSAQFDELCEAWLKLSSDVAVPSVPLSLRPSAGRVTKGS